MGILKSLYYDARSEKYILRVCLLSGDGFRAKFGPKSGQKMQKKKIKIYIYIYIDIISCGTSQSVEWLLGKCRKIVFRFPKGVKEFIHPQKRRE